LTPGLTEAAVPQYMSASNGRQDSQPKEIVHDGHDVKPECVGLVPLFGMRHQRQTDKQNVGLPQQVVHSIRTMNPGELVFHACDLSFHGVDLHVKTTAGVGDAHANGAVTPSVNAVLTASSSEELGW